MKNKMIKNETKILIMLAFFSVSIGIWSNYRQLWLQNNNLDISTISNLISIGTFASIIGILIITKLIKLEKMKTFITFSIGIKAITLLGMFFINGTNQIFVMKVLTIYDIIFEILILTSVYPLITTYQVNDKLYGKQKVIEYLFKDLGILIAGIIIGKSLFGLQLNFNFCLLLALLTTIISFIIILNIKESQTIEQKESKGYFKFLKSSKIHQLYLVYSILSSLSFNTVMGLKILIITEYFEFNVSFATNYLLFFGILADILGVIMLKWFTPKNDYLSLFLKFGIRFIGFAIAFFTNHLIVSIIAFSWTIISGAALENVTDAPYINSVPKEFQLLNFNIRRICSAIGESIGVLICGYIFYSGLNNIFGVAAIIMALQLFIAYYLIYLRKKNQ